MKKVTLTKQPPMEVKFTQECLVRLIYRETSATETLNLFSAMDENPKLLAAYERLMELTFIYLKRSLVYRQVQKGR